MILAIALSLVMQTRTTLTVDAEDFMFRAPQTAPAGIITIKMVNHGKELHMAGISRLNRDHTIAELLDALNNGKPAPWAVDVGGANAVAVGDTSIATVKLAPADYVIVCWVMSKDGKLHAQKGMIVPLEVTEPVSNAKLPPGDVVVKLTDYKITMPAALKRGKHTFTVTNNGPEEHDVQIFRLEKGGDIKGVDAWMNDPATGSPLAKAMGGSVGLVRGHSASFEVNLPAGNYVFLCWIPDEKGVPHYRAHRMYTRIKVS